MLLPLLAVLCTQLAGVAAGDATIETDGFAARVDALGLLRELPAGARTVDGPRVVLPGGAPTEWFGIAFDEGERQLEFGGAGTQPDWAGRAAVEPRSFDGDGRSALSISRAGDLLVRTEISFDGKGPYLLVAIELTNTGADTLRDLVYSREWSVAPEAGFSFPEDVAVAPAPSGIARRLWRLGDLAPGESAGLGLSWAPLDAAAPAGALRAGARGGALADTGEVDVPLEFFTQPDIPTGVKFGKTNGISFGDYDADGWPDVFACHAGRLWRNDHGTSWVEVADLDDGLLPPTTRRYGASFGDYDDDGLPDIGTEPRLVASGDTCLHLAHNLGGASFVDVAIDPAIVDVQPCQSYAETICWGDVDHDGRLDMFFPVYPVSYGSPGNFFLYNLGPTGPDGATRFTESSAPVGLDNPPGASRPEGAQFIDVDFDGDIDLYSNGTLYRNLSTPGAPLFEAMKQTGSGILNSNKLEEGAAFFDYDLDGDFDLGIVFTAVTLGVNVFECRGDGSFFKLDQSLIDSANIGLDLGLSAEDWDNDGDMDFTTRQVFRRNMFLEEGTRHFKVATHTIPPDHIDSATPSWGDWDKDGDLDCALGNWSEAGRFYFSTLYGPETPPAEKRHVRVRVMRDSETLDRGLETEYGAAVELVLRGDGSGHRWRKFVASSAGYLNQNEYVLHFALPPDPAPDDAGQDWHFDVSVDLIAPGGGLRRVDKLVNPLLGDLNLADLGEREIVVYRSGRVVLQGKIDAEPQQPAEGVLVTTGGGLVQPPIDAPLPEPQPAPGADHWVGLAFDVRDIDERRVAEIVLDGQLGEPVECGADAPANLVLWDVTDPATPVRAGALAATTSDRNARSYIAAGLPLRRDRLYRLVAHVTQERGSPLALPWSQQGVTVEGGLAYDDAEPCAGAAAAAATLDLASVPLAVRVTGAPETHWTRIAAGAPGRAGQPHIFGEGLPTPGNELHLTVSDLPPFSRAVLVAGSAPLVAALRGALLVPRPDVVLAFHVADAEGQVTVSGRWPKDTPAGFTVWLQAWVPSGDGEWSASDGLAVTSPF